MLVMRNHRSTALPKLLVQPVIKSVLYSHIYEKTTGLLTTLTSDRCPSPPFHPTYGLQRSSQPGPGSLSKICAGGRLRSTLRNIMRCSADPCEPSRVDFPKRLACCENTWNVTASIATHSWIAC